MRTSVRFARAAVLAAGVVSLLAPAGASAQRRVPRPGVAASPPPHRPSPPIGFPAISNGQIDPRFRTQGFADRRFQQRSRGSRIVYVPYAVGGYGYYDGYYGSAGAGQVYDVNGRPLSASYEQMSAEQMSSEPMPPSMGYGYTPDLSGSPYAITDEGMMVVDFAAGDRRAFPSCAAQGDLRDPAGRPRTIFYRQTDYWMILRPGQRGRVQGEPAPNTKACYAIDSTGRVVLRQ
jgi:hypothetical protein